MRKPEILTGAERAHLINELYERYAGAGSWKQRALYLRKKYAWLFVVQGAKFLKRLIDIVTSAVFLLIFSPLFILISIAIKVYDFGPVLYVTDRVGKWGHLFRFPKFRSMYVGAEKDKEKLKEFTEFRDEVTFKMSDDPRITPIGRFLRKTSLDEIPQFWSVLKGDMSLVGPRPPLVEEVSNYSIEQRRRLDVKPGLTCIWQVSGRSEIPFSQQVKLDLQYIESQSFWLDLKLLIKTIPAVIFGRGAY